MCFDHFVEHINHSAGLYEHEYYLNDLIDFEVTEITIERENHLLNLNEMSKITMNDPNKINDLLNTLSRVPIYTDYVSQNFGDTITYTVTFVGTEHQMILMKIDDSGCEVDDSKTHMVYGYHRTNKQGRMYSWYIEQFLKEYEQLEYVLRLNKRGE